MTRASLHFCVFRDTQPAFKTAEIHMGLYVLIIDAK